MGTQIYIPVDAGPLGLVQVKTRDEGDVVALIFVLIRGWDHSNASNDVDALFILHYCMLADIELWAV